MPSSDSDPARDLAADGRATAFDFGFVVVLFLLPLAGFAVAFLAIVPISSFQSNLARLTPSVAAVSAKASQATKSRDARLAVLTL
jgi:cytochrome b561